VQVIEIMSKRNNYPRNIIRVKTVLARDCTYRGEETPPLCKNPYSVDEIFIKKLMGLFIVAGKTMNFAEGVKVKVL